MKSQTTKVAIVTAILVFTLIPVNAQSLSGDGACRQNIFNGSEDDLTEHERKEILNDIAVNTERLRAEGRLAISMGANVLYDWPVKMAPGFGQRQVEAIVGYVDQDLAFPNLVRDWNCGARTYDLSTGYNHAGTDIRITPFRWNMMDQNDVMAVAAAPGVIVNKTDGNYDRNCSTTTPAPVNAIYIQHADGSVAWYLHLKRFSLTSKEIGETVEAGEYLGIIGSSGRSGGPHLHFEVYSPGGQLQDPFAGACNMMNPTSLWKTQEPYRVPRINDLATGSAIPVFSTCNEPEQTFEKLVFQPGETVVPSAHFRDYLAGFTTNFGIYRPDGTPFNEWSFTPAQDFNLSSRWAVQILPVDAPTGRWTYRVTYAGETAEHYFYVGESPTASIGGRVYDKRGNAIPYAYITAVSETTGSVRVARSNPFGYYHFAGLPVGERFNITVTAKGRTFNTRSVFLEESVSDLDHFPR